MLTLVTGVATTALLATTTDTKYWAVKSAKVVSVFALGLAIPSLDIGICLPS
jgi:hypothetical protein